MADIEARGLIKRYGDFVAVDSVSFEVARGEIFGLLGPNGAGKTTTLEMLEGLREPDGGTAIVLGTDIAKEPAKVKERIGVQLQGTALPPFTKVREAIELFCALFAKARPVSELLNEFDLESKANELTSKLSGGQLQRLSIALALVNDPDLVFLDEPTTGLDPQARLNLWDVIEGIRKRGKTVILTTHYMEEAERLCDRVAVMNQGRFVALDTPEGLIATYAPGARVEFELVEAMDADSFRSVPAVDSVTLGRRVSLTTGQPEIVLAHLLDPAGPWSAGGRSVVKDLAVHQGTLEDVFISVTGRSLQET
jgi:ABC-2 type transport system ATP-binding protein